MIFVIFLFTNNTTYSLFTSGNSIEFSVFLSSFDIVVVIFILLREPNMYS